MSNRLRVALRTTAVVALLALGFALGLTLRRGAIERERTTSAPRSNTSAVVSPAQPLAVALPGSPRRRSLASALARLRRAGRDVRASTQPTWATEEHLAVYPAEHRAHAAAVGRYINETFVPRVRSCLSHLKPTGDVEVTHSFVVDDEGVAVAAAIPDRTPSAATIVDADIDPAHADEVERCFLQAAATTSFPHVPLNELDPERSFVAHQVYRFERSP